MTARKLSDVDRAEIAALKARGKTSAAIAVKFKVSNAVVRRIAKLAAHDTVARLKLCACAICTLTFEAAQS
jgi:hypothetical protein